MLFAQSSATPRLLTAATRPVGAAGGGFGAVTVQVNVSTTFGGAPSFTVIETAYGLPVAAPAAMVPLMSPVAVLMDSPAGSPVAP